MFERFKKKTLPSSSDIESSMERLELLDKLSSQFIEKFFTPLEPSIFRSLPAKGAWYKSNDGWVGYSSGLRPTFSLIEVALCSRPDEYSDNGHHIRCPIDSWIPESVWIWWYGKVRSLSDPNTLVRVVAALDSVNLEAAIYHTPDVEYLRHQFIFLIKNAHYIENRNASFWPQSRDQSRIEALEKTINDLVVRHHNEKKG